MKQFFTKIFLAIAVFSLFIGVTGVAYGAEEPAEVSGVCIIANDNADAPTFYLPDVGIGYVKKANPGINTADELRQVCSKEVYQELFRQYCKQNSGRAEQGIVTYNKDGDIISQEIAFFRDNYLYCSSLGKDLSKITGVCLLNNTDGGDPSGGAPGFFDPDTGVGYSKKAQPGINSIEGLREVCTRDVYEELLVSYCKQNTGPAFLYVANYKEDSGWEGLGFPDFGNEFNEPMSCPGEEVPPEEVSTVIFPIPELGNCGSEGECHDYCEDLEHASACIAYAKDNNLLTEEDEKILEEFSDVIENGGPGGCKTEESCGAYCEDTSNLKECLGFVKKHNLLNDDEIKEVEKVVEAIENGGPGGCTEEEECRIYCEDMDHIEACADFAEEFDLVTSDELDEMRKMAAAREAGVSFPGNCKDKESCLAYCEDSARVVECMEFAQNADLLTEEENEEISKILPYLKSGGQLPGGCSTKESCDAYCDNDANTNVCMDFAVSAGFMTKEEADIVKKIGGKGPGNCRSREACDNYCKDEAHTDECIEFAVKAGFISQEDADQAKQFGISSGPGNCKSKTECEVFCVLPENQDVCFQFAKDHGMLSEEDLKNIEEQKQFFGSLDQAPPEWLACMEKELGPDFFGRFKTGKITSAEAKSPTLETAQRKCESLMGSEGQGPGGCKSQEECTAYCKDHQEECQSFAPQNGGGEQQQGGEQSQIPQGYSSWPEFCTAQPGDSRCTAYQSQTSPSSGDGSSPPPSGGGGTGGGPGGCQSPEECQAYCQDHPQECQQVTPPSGGDQSQTSPPSGGDQSQIPQGYSSWEEFCRAQPGDSRCTAYQPQTSPSSGGGSSPPPSSGDGGTGDQWGIPQGYSSWPEFCTAQPGDSRCTAYIPPQSSVPYKNKYTAAILQFLIVLFGSGH